MLAVVAHLAQLGSAALLRRPILTGGMPMIHVWTERHPCGPFAALEGIAGGSIAEGETRLCDRAHGGH